MLNGTRDAKQAAPVFSQICHAMRPVYCVQCNFLQLLHSKRLFPLVHKVWRAYVISSSVEKLRQEKRMDNGGFF